MAVWLWIWMGSGHAESVGAVLYLELGVLYTASLLRIVCTAFF